jgi:lycopene beta-cyclase
VQATRSAPGLRYETIRSDRFYDFALSRLAGAPHIDLRLGGEGGKVEGALEEADGVGIDLGDVSLRAGLVFDTRPAPALGQHGLTQRFLGQEIQTRRKVFDPASVVLMDFRVPQAGAAHFTYVLPFSEHHALVEDTWFAPKDMELPDHRIAIGDYLAARHNIADYDVLFEEHGALPMDPVFRPKSGRRLQALGSPAGANRPSTGYAFNAIQAHCDRIAADLLARRWPVAARARPAAIRAMDAVLLHLLHIQPGDAAHLFPNLFARCPPAALIRFLNDRASPADILAVTAAMPFFPMLSMAARLAMEGGKRSPVSG